MKLNASTRSALLGAAFLMATSAIGPGFIMQTTVFTQKLMASFGFVILISILLDLSAQINTWRIIAVSEKSAQEVANNVLPGIGHLLSILVVIGGLAFNIGNISGAGLGMNILFHLDNNLAHPIISGCISAGIALLLFWIKNTGVAMDWFSRILGLVMLFLCLYVVLCSAPPLKEVAFRTFWPQVTDSLAIITIVGGTVGGYISFAGAHRLLDAGIKGKQQLPVVTRSSVQGILLASAMRALLFIAALGVIAAGHIPDSGNPAAAVFYIAAGKPGYYMFGIVFWSAAITSVVGAAYTSVSFMKTWHPYIDKNQQIVITLFILVSTFIFVVAGNPVKVLILAGTLNGLVLPVALTLMLLAVKRLRSTHQYVHPLWMTIAGWVVVLLMMLLSIKVFITDLPKLFA